jgi:hypothetical protein
MVKAERACMNLGSVKRNVLENSGSIAVEAPV